MTDTWASDTRNSNIDKGTQINAVKTSRFGMKVAVEQLTSFNKSSSEKKVVVQDYSQDYNVTVKEAGTQNQYVATSLLPMTRKTYQTVSFTSVTVEPITE